MSVLAKKEQQFNQLVPLGDLDAYINWAQSIPVLSAKEEKGILQRLHQDGDIDAAKDLVLSHLRFVIYVSRSYAGYGLALADIIQEGNVGLMKAVRRFNPNYGVRLATFAVYWIKAEIQEYILKNWRIVKIATTKAKRTLFFKLRSFSKQANSFSADEVSYISSTLNVEEKDVREMEKCMANNHEMSFDPLYEDSETATSNAPAQYISARVEDTPEHSVLQQNDSEYKLKALTLALEQLDGRERDILESRWLDSDGGKATLHELAQRHAVSAERVRQIEKIAMHKVKHLLQMTASAG